MRKSCFLITIWILAVLCLAGCGSLNVSLDPDDSGAYENAMTALARAEYDTALTEFQKAADVDGRLAESYRGQGLVYFAKGEYKYAETLFDQSLDSMRVINQDFTEDVKYYKAECLNQMNENEKAEALYRELAQGARPEMANALLGRLYMKQQDMLDAGEYFNLAVSEAQDYEVFLLIYETCFEAGLEADGTAYLQKALELTPEDAKDESNLGKIYYYLNEPAEAGEHLRKAVDAGYEDAVWALGSLYLDQEDISSARTLYEESISRGMNQAGCFNGLAMCSLKEGMGDAALQYIAEGLKADNGKFQKCLLFNEMIAYEKILDFETARAKALEFLTQYPGDPKMKREFRFLTV